MALNQALVSGSGVARRALAELRCVPQTVDHPAREPDERSARISRRVAAVAEGVNNKVIRLGVGVIAFQDAVGKLGAHGCARGATCVSQWRRGADRLSLGQDIELAPTASKLHTTAGEEVRVRGESAPCLAHTPGDDSDLPVLASEDREDAIGLAVVDASQDHSLGEVRRHLSASWFDAISRRRHHRHRRTRHRARVETARASRCAPAECSADAPAQR